MQKIAAAGIRLDGQIYTGRTHSEAMDKLVRVSGLDHIVIASKLPQAEFGFVTETGHFLSRREAFQVARAAGQLRAGHWGEAEGEPDSLESPMVQSYAALPDAHPHIH